MANYFCYSQCLEILPTECRPLPIFARWMCHPFHGMMKPKTNCLKSIDRLFDQYWNRSQDVATTYAKESRRKCLYFRSQSLNCLLQPCLDLRCRCKLSNGKLTDFIPNQKTQFLFFRFRNRTIPAAERDSFSIFGLTKRAVVMFWSPASLPSEQQRNSKSNCVYSHKRKFAHIFLSNSILFVPATLRDSFWRSSIVLDWRFVLRLFRPIGAFRFIFALVSIDVPANAIPSKRHRKIQFQTANDLNAILLFGIASCSLIFRLVRCIQTNNEVANVPKFDITWNRDQSRSFERILPKSQCHIRAMLMRCK